MITTPLKSSVTNEDAVTTFHSGKSNTIPDYAQAGAREYFREKIDLNSFIQNEDGSVTQPPIPHEVLGKYAYLLITDRTEIPTPVPVVTIGGEVISTEGNITTISGAGKSGKSAFSSVLIAGAIAAGEYEGFTGVDIQPNDSEKAVLHFDTEQARHKHKHNLMTILRRCEFDTCPDFFYSYNIRELPLQDYRKVTTDIVSAAATKHHGVHLIIIDGIADYIQDVNDAESSNAIVSFFEKLAIKNACPVIAIVHTNPNNDKERGHLGSQLQRKSESVLTIQTANDISTLQPKFLRNAGKGNIPLIQFRYNPAKGYHEYCGVQSPEQTNRDAERIKAIKEIAEQVFSGQKSYGYNEAIERIMKAATKQERTAKDYFKEMKAHQFITKGEDNNYRSNK